MQRLSGMDAGFVWMETARAHMHVASVAVFDPSTVPGGFSPERLRSMVSERLPLLPPFRRRLIEVPLGLDRPVWIEDPDFDIDNHLRPVTLDAPGGREELGAFVSEVMARPLDRRRPLWEMHVVTGIADGRVAVVTKIHHAAVDGVSGTELTANLLDLSAEMVPVAPEAEAWSPDAVPSDVELVGAAAVHAAAAGLPLAGVKALRRTLETALALRQANRRSDFEPPPGPFGAPRTFLNRPISADRKVAFTEVPMEDVRCIKEAVGATVNDVVLAICAGGLRRWLSHRGDDPGRPLVALVPVNVRTADQRGGMGNRVSAMFVSLETTVDEPLARLVAIAESGSRAKQQARAIGGDLVGDLADAVPAALAQHAARLVSSGLLQSRLPPLGNVTISNVPGSPFPLYAAGAQMLSIHPLGPIADGMALNITVMNYLEHLAFGLVGCAEVLPDLDLLPGWLEESADALLKAVNEGGRGPAREGAAAARSA